MSDLIDALLRFSGEAEPSLDDLGGEALLVHEWDDILVDPSLASVVSVVCHSWSGLKQQDRVSEFLRRALQTDNLFAFADIVDDVLSSEAVLPALVNELVPSLRGWAGVMGLRGEIAIEAWTRLALGQWCSTLEVRSALATQAHVRHKEASETSSFFVRALGSALAYWGDSELETAMQQLVDIDGVESDAAYELGMFRLAGAAAAPTSAAAMTNLQIAGGYFRLADTDERSDAKPLLLTTESLISFSAGHGVSTDAVASLTVAVRDYLLGYSGERGHWRQPRAALVAQWGILLQELGKASTISDPSWIEPAAVIETAASIYTAARRLNLIVKSDADSEPGSDPSGLAKILEPRLKAGIGSLAHSIVLIDRWVAQQDDDRETFDEAVVRRMVGLRDQLAVGDSPPKVSSEPGEVAAVRSALNLPATAGEIVANAAAGSPEILPILMIIALPAERVSITEDRLVSRIVSQAKEITPDAAAIEPQLNLFALIIVRFLAFHLDAVQSGQRGIDWLGHSTDPYPHESTLADALNLCLCQRGLASQVERTNVGGGRVDIAVQFDRFRLTIEVKRELSLRSDDDLLAAFGTQAVQYASTDVALAFLGVLDFAPRESRVDLDGAIWVAPSQSESSSRTYAVTAFRVQGNVQPPSVSSRSRRGTSPGIEPVSR